MQINDDRDRVSFLELQLKEAQQREINLKKLNEQIMSAMNNVSVKEKSKEIFVLVDRYEQEIKTLKVNHSQLQIQFDTNIKELKSNYEQRISDLTNEKSTLNNQNSSLNTQIVTLSNELKQAQNKRCETCNYNLSQIELLKQHQQNEREEWAREAKSAIDNLKQIHEYEKSLLKIKNNQLVEEKDELLREIALLSDKLNAQASQSENQHKQLYEQINQAHQLHQNYISTNSTLLQGIQSREQELNQKEIFLETEKLKSEMKIKEFLDQINKLETFNRQLAIQIQEKDRKFLEYKQEQTRKFNLEKNKSDQIQELAQRIKDESGKRQTVLISETLSKDQKIKNLTTQLNRLQSRIKIILNTLSAYKIQLEMAGVNLDDLQNYIQSTPTTLQTSQPQDYISHRKCSSIYNSQTLIDDNKVKTISLSQDKISGDYEVRKVNISCQGLQSERTSKLNLNINVNNIKKPILLDMKAIKNQLNSAKTGSLMKQNKENKLQK